MSVVVVLPHYLILICVYPCFSAVAKDRSYFDINHTIETDIMATSSKFVIVSCELPNYNRFVYATSISPDRDTIYNRARAFYFKKESIQSFPPLYGQYRKKSFIDDLDRILVNASDGLQQEAFFSKSYPYLIIPMPEKYVLHNYT